MKKDQKEVKETKKEQKKVVKNQKSKAIKKAKKVQKLQKKGEMKKIHKTHFKTRFYRPKTLQYDRTPKYSRNAKAEFKHKEAFNAYSVILQPLATEKAMKKMEDENTMVFLVNPRSNKNQIRQAFTEIYQGKVRQVRTLMRPDLQKKAYIKLTQESDALTLANKIGLI